MKILKTISYDVWCVIKLTIFFMLDQVIAGLIMFKQMHILTASQLKIWQWTFYISALVVIAFMLWRYYQQIKHNNYLNYRPHFPTLHDIGIIIMGVIGIFLMEFIMGFVCEVLHDPLASSSANQQLVNHLSQDNPQAMFWFGVVFAPMMEELIFHGFFFNYFFKKMHGYRAVIGIVLDGCVFGYMHEQTHFLIWLVYTMLGCILATCYYRSKNIYVSMSVHMLNNFIAFV